MSNFLKGYRVLDLTEDGAMFCGRILGDLGADVIKIEPPGGASSRNLGPFYHGIPNPEKSLFWFSYNYNKRGITLNLNAQDGRELFKDLINNANFVIESFEPGYLNSLGLGYKDLSQLNPGLVMVSITGFGQTGPYSTYKAPDLVAMAMGGFSYTTGDPDRPPLTISFHHQAALHAAGDGAVGALLAHYHRETSGEGQHVDISAQESVVGTLMGPATHWDFIKFNQPRRGAVMVSPRTGVVSTQIWPCKNGYVNFELRFAAFTGKGLQALFDWMAEENMFSPGLGGISAARDDVDVDSMSQETLDQLSSGIGDFFLAHTKQELYAGARERNFMLFPVNTVAEYFNSPQADARSFFTPVEHPELKATFSYPGPFANITPETIEIKNRAPLIGEHNQEIYEGELGISTNDLVLLKQGQVI
ncbi:CaiB/BaiF CoA transferase family protein [Chloroflexota bacterium]